MPVTGSFDALARCRPEAMIAKHADASNGDRTVPPGAWTRSRQRSARRGRRSRVKLSDEPEADDRSCPRVTTKAGNASLV